MTPETLNTIGLISNILGVILIFFFGLPQPTHDEGEFIEVEEDTCLSDGSTVKEKNAKIRNRKVRYKTFAYLALVLLLAGFIFQFLAIHTDLLPFH